MRTNTDDNVTLAYGDSTDTWFDYSLPALHDYYCGDCGLEWRATDPDHCPACQSSDIYYAGH